MATTCTERVAFRKLEPSFKFDQEMSNGEVSSEMATSQKRTETQDHDVLIVEIGRDQGCLNNLFETGKCQETPIVEPHKADVNF